VAEFAQLARGVDPAQRRNRHQDREAADDQRDLRLFDDRRVERRQHPGQGADDAPKRQVGPEGGIGQKFVAVLVPGDCVAQAGTRHDARDVDDQDGQCEDTEITR
jgi:hypothetical protein